MKRNQLSVLMSFCLIFFIAQTSSAKKEEMKLFLNNGQHYIYLITQESTIQDNGVVAQYQKMALKIDHKVINQLPNGNYQIEAIFKSFSIVLNYNGKILRYTSDTVDVGNALYKTLNFFTDIKLNYEVSPHGIVNMISGFEPIKEKIKTDSRLSSLLRSFGNEQFILEMYHYLPEKSIRIGIQWTKPAVLPDLMDLKYEVQYTLKEVTAQNMKVIQKASFKNLKELPKEVETEGKIDENGTQNGFLLINPNTKMRISSDIDQQIYISVQEKTNQKDEKTLQKKISTHTTMVLVKN